MVSIRDIVWVLPDSEDAHGEAWLVMDLAGGGGLFERLVSEGVYSECQAAAVLQQVAMAVYHLHSRGIVHRNIKPEHVVFSEQSQARRLLRTTYYVLLTINHLLLTTHYLLL